MVLHNRWALMTTVSQDRFHCIYRKNTSLNVLILLHATTNCEICSFFLHNTNQGVSHHRKVSLMYESYIALMR